MIGKEAMTDKNRETSFGTEGLTLLDRFGIWLSRKAILRAVENRTNLEVLEIGCGFQARNLLAIADNAASLTGIDFNLSPQLQNIPRFLGIVASFEDAIPQLSGQQFDLIMIISVLEHFDKPLQTLRDCRCLLKPGGLLIINVPTWRGKFFLEYSAFKLGWSPKLEMDDHKMYYDKRDLWPVLVKSGFLPSQIHMRYHKFGLNLFATAAMETK
jgi:2-polyprenyl-3-methyl-5-hydroxy-6-metoxy-1,4-benzoquinol methylase